MGDPSEPDRPVGFVTSRRHPGGTEDDRLVLDRLVARGVDARPVVWDDPTVRWGDLGLAVLRSTWDYHLRYREFLDWLAQVERATVVLNPPDLVRWNAHKGYLTELADGGIDVVPTVVVPPGETTGLRRIVESEGWDRVVLKPAVSASGRGLLVLGREDLDRAEPAFRSLVASEGALVQPFQAQVRALGERSLVFVDGAFSHAVAYPTVLESPDRSPRPWRPGPDDLARGDALLGRWRPRPLYARIDLLPSDDGRWRLGELELIEPELFFGTDPSAVDRFAGAILERREGAAGPRAREGRPTNRSRPPRGPPRAPSRPARRSTRGPGRRPT